MTLSLENRRAVVMGASRGIGLATAFEFAAAGADVSICSRSTAALDEAAVRLAQHGTHIHAATCDIAIPDQIDRYMADAEEALGGIDILINNATAARSGNTEEDWLGTLDVDLMGTVRAVRAARPFLEASGDGRIVNLASRNAFGPSPRVQAYAAVKAAIMHLTTSQAAELAPAGIRVNCVAPGSTEFAGGFWARCRTERPDYYAQTRATFPFGRFGHEDDVSGAILFLVSPMAAWITGQTLLVDGGQTLSARPDLTKNL